MIAAETFYNFAKTLVNHKYLVTLRECCLYRLSEISVTLGDLLNPDLLGTCNIRPQLIELAAFFMFYAGQRTTINGH